jgi:hypothetical protein
LTKQQSELLVCAIMKLRLSPSSPLSGSLS